MLGCANGRQRHKEGPVGEALRAQQALGDREGQACIARSARPGHSGELRVFDRVRMVSSDASSHGRGQ